MLNDFIDHALAHADDLAELKVSLAALRLLDQKALGVVAPFVTERELRMHPAVRDGLSFPAISLRPALQRAAARGTLLAAQIGDEAPRYFANDPAGRRTVDMLHQAMEPQEEMSGKVATSMRDVAREIERLEQIDIYAPLPDDALLVEEWVTCGYTPDEIKAAVQLTLRSPRSKHLPARGIKEITATLLAAPPAMPGEYFEMMVARTKRMPDEIINLRERLDRPPTPREFVTLRNAVGLFGLRATLDCLKRIAANDSFKIEALLPVLAEQEASAMELQRTGLQIDEHLRDLVTLYEASFGLPPTGAIANEMQALWKDVSDMTVWRGVFEYAARQNKRSWPYVRKIILNPSHDVFAPAPVNEAAQFAFNEYKRRVDYRLDASIANQINLVAQTVTDTVIWKSAFDKAASAAALNWNYIKKVLTSPVSTKSEKSNGRAKYATSASSKRGGNFRRPQVTYTDEQRKVAEERARQRLEERAKQREGSK